MSVLREANGRMLPKYDWNAVLNAWKAGETGPEIEARLGLPRGGANKIVAQARAKKDPRAAIRRPGGNVTVRMAWQQKALALHRRGEKPAEIAEAIGRSVSAVHHALRGVPGYVVQVGGNRTPEATIERYRATAAERLKDIETRLPSLVAEHGTLQAVARATGRCIRYIRKAARRVMPELFAAKPSPEPAAAAAPVVKAPRAAPKPKAAPARKPQVKVPPMSVGTALRVAFSGTSPRQEKPPMVICATSGGDPKLDRALGMLRRNRELSAVVAETRLPLREVIRLQGQVREERRSQNRVPA